MDFLAAYHWLWTAKMPISRELHCFFIARHSNCEMQQLESMEFLQADPAATIGLFCI